MAQVGSHNESRTGAAAVVAPVRVYPVYNATTKVLSWSDTGPAEVAFVYDSGTNIVTVDDSPSAAGALSITSLASRIYKST